MECLVECGFGLVAHTCADLSDALARVRQLIVAVTTRCDGCITVHTAQALTHGATHDEIAYALSVAISLNAGAALVYSARVMDAVQAYENA
ncbi:Carboxymuconolactone decarboxylase family protein [Ralstonia mannitolilytica]|uniref:Alkylhydroperoxidase AhpD family core domain n=1 Tax=Ralstonia mannitolilytica TaxID=105219 RepID=A0AAJ5D4C2_9RALS|nr:MULTISPECIES: carboxymuconolactone decarboxylase family protein [Ralstonia]CAG2150498.1 hypothetical protein LMG6866_03903 [Ralstonia mannitolilytica]CAJ0724761.1 hypothetical protein R77592_00424 [Ralstonia mannitolilytica]CAJ0783233.1 hypothetical protein R77555_01047 [Ralstonia mannitolilytica]SUD87493.1 alkylhydroperoxidase AhpD family core domain [Ralstonia mannitolilytica]SUD93413.1 alkylhydroperoxidase AhpD family core domain [Ralstonia mannitolilytica]